MPSLRELQHGFRRALLDGDAGTLASLIVDDGMSPAERLDVYRNNVVSSLTATLQDTFPVLCRLVDERFFAYAAHEFIRAAPPKRPCLAEYGARFPAFIAAFPPCRELVYLADVARLEWAVHRAANAPDEAPLDPASLRHVAAESAPHLVFRLRQSYAYLASPWPIDRIWRANRGGAAVQTIDLGAGGVNLEIRRQRGDVEMRRLPAALFAFRHALSAGRNLAAATEAALGEEEAFDVTDALAGLAGEAALTGFAIEKGETP